MRIEAFTRYNEMTGDAYVMDYTQATAGKRKVCIKEEDPDDIASFHLINPRKTTYWAVNFEENPAVLKGSDQCECMFVSVGQAVRDGFAWLNLNIVWKRT